MALNRRQQQMASRIMQIARNRGVPANRLRELAFAAYKESGLRPEAVNASSGAAGLFQLLSPHYRERAEQLGGLHKPKANLLAILPDYLEYWKKYPRAPAGQAARDVERSGMGSEWYAPTSDFISSLGAMPAQTTRPSMANSNVDVDPPSFDRSGLMSSLMEMASNAYETGRVDVSGVIESFRDLRAEAMEKAADAAGSSGNPLTGVTAPAGEGGTPSPGTLGEGIMSAPLPSGSAFDVVNAEGMPGPGGKRYHAALDWFAPPGTEIRSPINGMIVEVEHSDVTSGQVFGGTVKVQGPKGRVWVFRHVNPKNFKVGQKVRAGQAIAGVTDWTGGADHTHVELWKSLGGGYERSNALDPLPILRRLQGG